MGAEEGGRKKLQESGARSQKLKVRTNARRKINLRNKAVF
jgi:hypothetical protein